MKRLSVSKSLTHSSQPQRNKIPPGPSANSRDQQLPISNSRRCFPAGIFILIARHVKINLYTLNLGLTHLKRWCQNLVTPKNLSNFAVAIKNDQGEMPEWSIGAVSKTVVPFRYPGFESLSLRIKFTTPDWNACNNQRCRRLNLYISVL